MDEEKRKRKKKKKEKEKREKEISVIVDNYCEVCPAELRTRLYDLQYPGIVVALEPFDAFFFLSVKFNVQLCVETNESHRDVQRRKIFDIENFRVSAFHIELLNKFPQQLT